MSIVVTNAVYSGVGMLFAIAMAYASGTPTWKSWAWWVSTYVVVNVALDLLVTRIRRSS